MKVLLTALFLGCFYSLMSQTLEWEISIPKLTNYGTGMIKDACIVNDNIYALNGHVSYNVFDTFPVEVLKIDDSLNVTRLNIFDSLYRYSFGEGIIPLPNQNKFLIFGGAKKTYSSDQDFIALIDTVGSIIWSHDLEYPYPYHYTAKSGILLADNTFLIAGTINEPNSGQNYIARRLDSMGNIMWEKSYPSPYAHGQRELIEMYDGSYLICGNTYSDQRFLRIDVNGNLLDSIVIQGNGSNLISHFGATLIQGQRLLISDGGWVNNIYQNQVVTTDIDLQPVSISTGNEFSKKTYRVNKDSTYYVDEYLLDPVRSYLSLNDFNNIELNLTQLPLDSFGREMYHIENLEGDTSVIVTGFKFNRFSNNESDYWIGKINNVKKAWIPDPCEISPPKAKLYYDYNYPLLTVYDSSYSGLKYHDTVYSWQWTTSLGDSSNVDSMLVFLDTSNTKTVDIELIISNWYGCTDTINKTLDFTSTAVKEIQDHSFKVYPNPSKGKIYFENEGGESGELRIYTIDGVELRIYNFNNENRLLEINLDTKAVLFYRVTTSKSIQTGKLIVE